MATSAAAAAAVIRAVKASGVVVRVEPEHFLRLLARAEAPLVVHAPGGLFSAPHHYLMSYKGLAFATRASQPLPLPATAELVEARRIWIPS